MASTEKNSENPVLIDGKRFESDCLPPMVSTDLLCYLVLETSYYMQKTKPSAVSRSTIKSGLLTALIVWDARQASPNHVCS